MAVSSWVSATAIQRQEAGVLRFTSKADNISIPFASLLSPAAWQDYLIFDLDDNR